MKMKKLFSYPGYCPGKDTLRSRRRTFSLVGLVCGAFIFSITLSGTLVLLATPAWSHEADPHPHAEDSAVGDTKYKHSEHGGLGEIGAKLANPLGDVWALTFSNNMPAFYDGDVNKGDPQMGAATVFEPILPIPLYGSGAGEWRMVTRPIIPILWSEPIPTGIDQFKHLSGIGDIQLPLLFNLPASIAGHWIMGAGPVGLLPTATNNDLGENQWAMGPAVVFGYKTKKLTLGVFPNYFWKIGSSGQNDDQKDVSKGSLLYFFNYMLPNAWQVGFNPTITYNDQADGPDQWSVPVGGYVGKTIKLGKLPINIKAGGEYSVVSPDTFGQRFQFRFQITPVIQSLIKNPIFGK